MRGAHRDGKSFLDGLKDLCLAHDGLGLPADLRSDLEGIAPDQLLPEQLY